MGRAAALPAISASVGEQRYQAWAYRNAPIRRWIRIHRAMFEQLCNEAWRKPFLANDTPPDRLK